MRSYKHQNNKIVEVRWPDYVLECTECGERFRSQRVHNMTCSPKCRKRRQRRLSLSAAGG